METTTFSRRAILGLGLAAGAAAAFPSPALALASRGERTLGFENLHTGEMLRRVYWADGSYVPDAVTEIDHILRDHRANAVRQIDRRLFDLLHELHSRLESSQPFQVVSAYRTRQTNEMLRRRSGGGVAKNSYHVKGMAIDLRVPGRKLTAVRKVAKDMRRGGVGYYPRSDFVHVDTGPVRAW